MVDGAEEWAILDYKSGDKPDAPTKAHVAKSGELRDLQLPLYALLAAELEMGEAPMLGYFALGSAGERHHTRAGIRRERAHEGKGIRKEKTGPGKPEPVFTEQNSVPDRRSAPPKVVKLCAARSPPDVGAAQA